MPAKSSKIICNYVLREIVGTTVLSTLVLTAILLYGNLSKHDEDLFRALSISPLIFLELISLMLPFALSLGLPFGFSLAVIFCVGRWSADREILAMQSLGMKRTKWMKPIVILSFFVSIIACFASLQWSPISKGVFENRLKEIAWQDFQSWIESGREIGFDMGNDAGRNLISGLDSDLHQQVERASLFIGQGGGDEWRNVRISMWSVDGALLSMMHAKRSNVVKSMENGTIELDLKDVDYESFERKDDIIISKNNFVFFKKWKSPLKFSIESPNIGRNIKRLSFIEFCKNLNNRDLSETEISQGCKHFNKYASIAFSPVSICVLLISVAIKRGRRESYSNLFTGALICLLYFIVAATLGESAIPKGWGWWLANITVLTVGGLMCLKKN